MNALDFISISPRTYIFDKKTNKTNLGGVLTFIYLIILVIIIFIYLYDYFHNATYEFSYFYKHINREDREGLKENNELNPVTTFRFKMRDGNSKVIDDKFVFIMIPDEGPAVITNTDTKRVDKIKPMIFYKCLKDNFDDICLNKISAQFELNIYYDSLAFDHENPNSPVHNSTINYVQILNPRYYNLMESYWEVFNYEEKKGIISKIYDHIFSKQNNFTSGYIQNSLLSVVENYDFFVIDEIYLLKPIVAFKIFNKLEGIHLYKRKAISIWNYLANICSLGLTIYSGLCTVFRIVYSTNFDDYKIMENILSKDKKFHKIIQLNNIIPDKSSIDILDKNSNNEDNKEYLIIKYEDNLNDDNQSLNDINDNNKNEDEDEKYLNYIN